jgi:hypothetical protein
MKNGASAGFEAYEYPRWSTILGWFVFAGCIIPIPLFYLINYIKEYLSIPSLEIVRFSFSNIFIFIILIN